ncbi:MAG: hypothetical protein V3S51_04540 [Dehalococcoidia bacterium]
MIINLQITIEHTLKERLENIKTQKRIPMSSTIPMILNEHLPEFERNHGIQSRLPE